MSRERDWECRESEGHLGVDVEHDNPPEGLGVELHRSLVVRVNVLHSDRLFDLLLRLFSVRV